MKNEVSENFISDYDKEIKEIADYTVNFSNFSDLSRQTAYHVLLDSIACGILALKNESCKNLLGPSLAALISMVEQEFLEQTIRWILLERLGIQDV